MHFLFCLCNEICIVIEKWKVTLHLPTPFRRPARPHYLAEYIISIDFPLLSSRRSSQGSKPNNPIYSLLLGNPVSIRAQYRRASFVRDVVKVHYGTGITNEKKKNRRSGSEVHRSDGHNQTPHLVISVPFGDFLGDHDAFMMLKQ